MWSVDQNKAYLEVYSDAVGAGLTETTQTSAVAAAAAAAATKQIDAEV